MKKVNNFQIAKVQSQVVTQLLLTFFANFVPNIGCKKFLIRKNRVRFSVFNHNLKFFDKHFEYFSLKLRGRGRVKRKMILKVMLKFTLLTFLTVAVAPTVTESASSVNYILIVCATFLDFQFPSICYSTLVQAHLPCIR